MRTVTQSFLLLISILFGSKIAFSQQHPTCGFDHWTEVAAEQDPELKKQLEEFKTFALPQLSALSNAQAETGNILVIPTVIHIIHNGEAIGEGQNLSDDRIFAQLAALNEDFAGLNPEFGTTPSQWQDVISNANIQFCLAETDPDGNPTNGIDRVQMTVTGSSWTNNNINSQIKPATNWDPDRYFNVYVVPIPGTTAQGGVVGYSNFPLANLIGVATDGPVVDFRWFGGPGFGQSGYRTLTHETGHYLGLPHPFEGDSCSDDDGIEDTPNISDASSDINLFSCANGYPTGPMTCGNEHMYVNYMDYADESCYTSFSLGQVSVMRSVLDGTSSGFGYGSREELVNNSNFVCTLAENDAGVLDILSPPSTVCSAEPITPRVMVRNFGTQDITSLYVIYQINGNTPDSLLWSGNLASGDNFEISLNTFSPPEGFYDFKAYTSLPNGVEDQRTPNDSLTFVNVFAFHPIAPPLLEDMENEPSFPTTEGIFPIQVNPVFDDFEWIITDAFSAYEVGSWSLVFNNFDGSVDNNPFGTTDALITPHFDFSNVQNASLTFDVAYAPFDATFSDTLIILAASDCSPTFNQLLYFKGGTDLASAPAIEDIFIPTATDWRTETVDLSMFDGISDVTFAFVNLSGWGNLLFLDNINVGLPCNLALEISGNNPLCFNECSGSVSVNALGGMGNLTYEWSNGATTASVSNICAGNYEVTVTDANGCSSVTSVTISEPPALSLNVSSTNESALNAHDGTALAIGGGGSGDLTYLWNTGATTATISDLEAGNYFVTVTDEFGCTITDGVTVSAFDCSAFGANVLETNVSCFGLSNGSAFAMPQGGMSPFSYNWSSGQTTSFAADLAAGSYSVTIMDANDCPTVENFTITQPLELEVNTTATSETGNNANDGTATVEVSGGTPNYIIQWSTGATNVTSIAGLMPGNYSVTVMDDMGCLNSSTVTVNSFDCGAFGAAVTETDVTCFGENNGTASVLNTLGNPPFNFNWSNGMTTQMISNLVPAIYEVTVADANGCSSVLSVEIDEPLLLEVNLSTSDESSNNGQNGTASAVASGGTAPLEYLWSNGLTTSEIDNLAPGNYGLTVTDANDCLFEMDFTINAFNCALTAQLQTQNASCPDAADGSAMVIDISGGEGPYTYMWSNGASGLGVVDLMPGNYDVTILDDNNCEIVRTFEIQGIDIENPVVLVNEMLEIELDASGNASLIPEMLDNGSFDNCGIANMSVNMTSFDCADVGPNIVMLTVIDENGNSSLGVATVTVLDKLAPSITCPDDIFVNACGIEVEYELPVFSDNCDNAEMELISGFESGAFFPVGETITTYQVTDAGGNTADCSFAVFVDSEMQASYTIHEPSCAGFADGFISVDVVGGIEPYQLEFSGGGDPVDLATGTYTISVTDEVGCEIIDTLEVGEPAELTFTLNGTSDAMNGQNGTASISVGGGTMPYSFDWQLEGSSTQSIEEDPTDLVPGDYTLFITDVNGCILITEPITIGNIVGTHDVELARRFRLFPNPTTGQVLVQLDLPTTTLVHLEILDVTGKSILVLQPQLLISQPIRLNLTGQAEGVYLIRVVADGAVATKRIVLLE